MDLNISMHALLAGGPVVASVFILKVSVTKFDIVPRLTYVDRIS